MWPSGGPRWPWPHFSASDPSQWLKHADYGADRPAAVTQVTTIACQPREKRQTWLRRSVRSYRGPESLAVEVRSRTRRIRGIRPAGRQLQHTSGSIARRRRRPAMPSGWFARSGTTGRPIASRSDLWYVPRGSEAVRTGSGWFARSGTTGRPIASRSDLWYVPRGSEAVRTGSG